MRTRRSARTNLAIYSILTILMAIITLLILAGAAVSIASAQVPGKNGKLLIQVDTFGQDPNFSKKLATVDADGSSLKYLTPPVDGFTGNGIFAPDGKSIAFGTWALHPDNERGIFSMGLQDSAPEFIWETPDPLLYFEDISYSPSGKTLLLTHYETECATYECVDRVVVPPFGIYARDLNAGTTKNLSLDKPGIQAIETDFSPDGRRIAIVATDGPNFNGATIYLTSNRGTGTRKVFHTNNRIWDVSFSPDGRRLAFTVAIRTENRYLTDIYTIKTDGSDLNKVTGDEISSSPVYSPDGTLIAMNKDAGPNLSTPAGIWTADVDDEDARPIMRGDIDEVLVDWARARLFRIVSVPPKSFKAMVQTWGPGTVSVGGPVFAKRKRITRTAGIVRVPISVKRGIRLRAGAKFKLNVRFAPKGGLPSTMTRYIKLG